MERTAKKGKKSKKAKKHDDFDPIEPITQRKGKKSGKTEETAVTKEINQDGLLRFKKIGPGVMRLHGNIIKENQIFFARFDSIPKGFRDVVICLDQEQLLEDSEYVEPFPTSVVFTKVKAAKDGMFNIITPQGKMMNHEPLTEKEAQRMLNLLNS